MTYSFDTELAQNICPVVYNLVAVSINNLPILASQKIDMLIAYRKSLRV